MTSNAIADHKRPSGNADLYLRSGLNSHNNSNILEIYITAMREDEWSGCKNKEDNIIEEIIGL